MKNEQKQIFIEENQFTYIPIMGNDGSTPQAGDIIVNGWRSQHEFWSKAVYVSGDRGLFASWKVIQG